MCYNICGLFDERKLNMSRPQKVRTVCCEKEMDYGPIYQHAKGSVKMTVEEFETIRLIDYEKLSQLECSELMKVSRTTVQSIYEAARYKISDALMNEKSIIIRGGNYKLCDKEDYGKRGCEVKLCCNGHKKYMNKGKCEKNESV